VDVGGETMSATAASPMNRAIRRSALLLLGAFVIEVFSLLWKSPLAFFLFLGIGGLLALLGMVSYLLSLVSSEATRP